MDFDFQTLLDVPGVSNLQLVPVLISSNAAARCPRWDDLISKYYSVQSPQQANIACNKIDLILPKH